MRLLEFAEQNRVEQLVVLTVSRLTRLIPEEIDTLECVLEGLDVAGCCFEQFYAQDVRTQAGWIDTWGGAPAFCALDNALSGRDEGGWLGIVQADTDHVAPGPAFGEIPPVVAADTTAILDQLNAVFSRHRLCWIHAGLVTPEQVAALIRGVCDSVRRQRQDRGRSCGLIVTSCRGTQVEISPPFESRISESLIRVPLWIDIGSGHPRREQALTGSFDLVHAVSRMLGLSTDEPVGDDSPESLAEHTQKKNVAATQNALPDTPPVLMIQGDEFIAARSESAMVVRLHAPEGGPASPDAEDHVHLYLKPEDVWNVHDQSTVYVQLRDELLACLPNGAGG